MRELVTTSPRSTDFALADGSAARGGTGGVGGAARWSSAGAADGDVAGVGVVVVGVVVVVVVLHHLVAVLNYRFINV